MARVEKFERSNPRLVQIHSNLLIRRDAFESGEHEARRKMLKLES
jgi:hypothetical protein